MDKEEMNQVYVACLENEVVAIKHRTKVKYAQKETIIFNLNGVPRL